MYITLDLRVSLGLKINRAGAINTVATFKSMNTFFLYSSNKITTT